MNIRALLVNVIGDIDDAAGIDLLDVGEGDRGLLAWDQGQCSGRQGRRLGGDHHEWQGQQPQPATFSEQVHFHLLEGPQPAII